MESFLKLCEFSGKRYAVKSKGTKKSVGKADYFVNKHMTNGNEYVVTIGYNGMMVGRGYASEQAALDDVENIHAKLKAMSKDGFLRKKELEAAEQITEKKYVEMITEEMEDEA